MVYPSRELLRLALEELEKRYSPLLIISVPCMLANRVPKCSTGKEAQDEAIEFGAAEEREWLDKYFRVPGGPGGKPYYQPGTGQWVQERYPGRALQRQRKAYEGLVFYHPDPYRWAFREDFASKLHSEILDSNNQPAVSLAALMIWMWRDRDIKSLSNGLKSFIRELGFDQFGVVSTVYDDTLPSKFEDAGLQEEPIVREDLADLLGAQAPPPKTPSLDDATDFLEQRLEKGNFLAPSGLVERIIGGWLVGDIVVLVGPTGSGKTFLSTLLSEGLEDFFGKDRFYSAFLEVGPGYDIAQFLGYENLAGEFTSGQFANEVLFVGEPSDPRLVVLDEWNLAQIDSYFAPILSAVESQNPQHIPGRFDLDSLPEEERDEIVRAQPHIREGKWILPNDTFLIATCNSWMDEPETRLPISGPVKRRCRIIPMPNLLELKLEESGRDGLREVCNRFLAQERDDLEQRRGTGRMSVWDAHRQERLENITMIGDLPDETEEKLLTLSRILLDNDLTKASYTPGILRDVFVSCVYAQDGEELAALGQELADKVLHQVHGNPEILEVLHGQTRDLPNAEEIDTLVRRMGAFSGDRRIRPLV